MGSTDGSGAGMGGDGGDTSGSGGSNSAGGSSSGGGTSSTGGSNAGGATSTGGGGSGGQDGVVDGALRFVPAKLVIDPAGSSEVSLRFDAEDGFDGELEVELSGADGTLIAAPDSLELSADSPAESVQVIADGDAAPGRYTLEATAIPADGGEAFVAELEVTISGRPGELDVTLGDGAGYFDFQPEGPCSAESVVMLGDGRFVVVGQALTSKLMLARFHEDGSPDTTFGSNGVLIQPDVVFVRSSPVLLQDGSLLIAFDQGSISLAKIRDDGSMDDSWGEAGILTTDLRAGNHVAFAVDDEERILLGGGYYDESTAIYQPVLRRLLPDGALDESFAGDGTLELGLVPEWSGP